MISDGIISSGDPEVDPSVVQTQPPTQVIGLGRITEGGEADQRLSDIAELTGGEYFRGVTLKQLAPVLDTIDSVALCELTALPTAVSGTGAQTTPVVGEGVQGALPESTKVTRGKPAARFTTRLIGAPSVVDLTLTFAEDLVRRPRGRGKTSGRFVVSPLVVKGGKRPTRVPAAKLRRALAGHTVRSGPLRIRGSRGASFATLRIKGLRKATAGTVGAHAASGNDKLSWGGNWKPARHKPKNPKPRSASKSASSATTAAAARSARISLSAYKHR